MGRRLENLRQLYMYDTHSFTKAISFICCMLVAIAIALLPFSYGVVSIRIPINLLYTALILLVVLCYRQFEFVDIKNMAFPLICYAVVVCMAFISLVFAADSSSTFRAIRQYLLEPLLFMFLAYYVVKGLGRKGLVYFFCAVVLALCYHPIITIYDFLSHNGSFGYYRAMLPTYYAPATVYVFYLIVCFSFVFGIFLLSRDVLKIASFIFGIVCIFAFLCNGGRFALLACMAICFTPFVLCQYRKKARVLFGVSLFCVVAVCGVYELSQSWHQRFNLHNIAQNFHQVWSSNPAEMGKFSNACSNKWLMCSTHSMDTNSSIKIEESSLIRISMLKSTLLAIADNPWRPNGYHFQQFPYNIQNIFAIDSPKHPFSLTKIDDNRLISAHAHNHNYIVSIWFELGAIGFGASMLFFAYFIWSGYREKIRCSIYGKGDIRDIFMLSVSIMLVALFVSNLFDCIPIRDGTLVLFILLGAFMGARYAR
ncbi:hypothetical protein C6B36_03080 [Helicobacter cinaedi]|uniref:O-antigen ligase family protein n=1 Tax=Helicobacter cinaedi TaxID=213 RepID=UPI000CF1A0FE|nr:O-antigen ligase family protein [Helicobacter cinaedi]AWK61439.1 hypothetical protein C6B36_03080 [Helicobacter cinaedi]QOQ96156.1 O-antigen ligase family protein [Helicobacter cinaedi]